MPEVSENVRPFEISRERSRVTLLAIVGFGLLCLIISNIPYIKSLTLFGGSAEALWANIGFALVTLAAFQWRYEDHHREVFFREIRNEMAGAESARNAGIGFIARDSKRMEYTDLVKKSRVIEVGVSYSDRFFKDYLSCLLKRNDLTIRVFLSNIANEELIYSLAFMVRKDKDYILKSSGTLSDFLDQIEKSGTKVERIPMNSISHYSFIRFDEHRTFLVLSTFSSRRADVPCIDLPYDGFMKSFVDDDISSALETKPCHVTSEQKSKSWYKNILPRQFFRNSA